MNVKRAFFLPAVLGLTFLGAAQAQDQSSPRPDAFSPAPPTSPVAPQNGPRGEGGGFGGGRLFGGGGQFGGGGFGGGGMGSSTSSSSSFFTGMRDPMSAEIDRAVDQLGKAKSDAEKEKMKAELSQKLEKQFDQRQKRHEADIEALETQIKKLKELVKTRNDNRKEIVSRRLEQLVRDSQGLGW